MKKFKWLFHKKKKVAEISDVITSDAIPEPPRDLPRYAPKSLELYRSYKVDSYYFRASTSETSSASNGVDSEHEECEQLNNEVNLRNLTEQVNSSNLNNCQNDPFDENIHEDNPTDLSQQVNPLNLDKCQKDPADENIHEDNTTDLSQQVNPSTVDKHQGYPSDINIHEDNSTSLNDEVNSSHLTDHEGDPSDTNDHESNLMNTNPEPLPSEKVDAQNSTQENAMEETTEFICTPSSAESVRRDSSTESVRRDSSTVSVSENSNLNLPENINEINSSDDLVLPNIRQDLAEDFLPKKENWDKKRNGNTYVITISNSKHFHIGSQKTINYPNVENGSFYKKEHQLVNICNDKMLSATPNQMLDIKDKLSEDDLLHISLSVREKWRELARNLCFDEAVIQELEELNDKDYNLIVYDLLQQYLNRFPDTTVGYMINILRKSNETEAVRRLIESR